MLGGEGRAHGNGHPYPIYILRLVLNSVFSNWQANLSMRRNP